MKKLLLILVLASTNLFAQDSIQPISLEEVQVVGIKSKKSDPVSITNIDIDSIKSEYLGDDPFFLIKKQTPNILTQSDNGTPYGYSYIRMRGLDQTRINFTLNGIPMNEMEDQGIYFSNMPDFLSNVEDIEVQRGIGTSKYGTTSFAGSVSMKTRSPLKKELRADLGYGSFNTQRYTVGFSSGLMKDSRFAFRSNLSYLETDGFRYNSGTKGRTAFNEIGYYGDKNTIKLWGFNGRSENQMAWLAPNDSLINEDYRTNLNSPDEIDDFNQNLVALNWVNYSRSNFVFNTSIYFNNINGYYTALLLNSLGRFQLNSYQTGGMTNIVYTKNNTSINGGLNYNWYQRKHTLADNLTPNQLWYKNWGYKQDWIGYVKWNQKLDNFNLFVDLQYRHVTFNYDGKKTWNWDFINPKVGVKYFGSFYNFYVSVASTSREVTRSDLLRGYDDVEHLGENQFRAIVDADIDTFNVNFQPERCYDIEIGGNIKSNGINLDINGYFMYFNNERVTYGEINYIGLNLRKPVERSFRTGIEADISYTWKGLSIGTNVSPSYNKINKYISSDGTEFINVTHANTPCLLMNNYVEYSHKRFLVRLNGSYVSSMFLDNTQNPDFTTPQYYILNGSLGYREGNVEVVFTTNNITNQKYYLPGGVDTNFTDNTDDDRPSYYVGALRNFFVNVKIRL